MKQFLAIVILALCLYVALAAAVPQTSTAQPLERAAEEIVASIHLR